MVRQYHSGVYWCILVVTSFFLLGIASSGGFVKQQTEIEVNNPAPIGVQVEIKCNWDHSKQRFAFHDWITIKRRSKKTVIVPFGMKQCQLWPKIVW